MRHRTTRAPDRIEQYAREAERKPGGGPSRERDSEARGQAILRPWTLPDGAEAKAAEFAEWAGGRGGWAHDVPRVLDMLGIGGQP
jgi:hypothetical protein